MTLYVAYFELCVYQWLVLYYYCIRYTAAGNQSELVFQTVTCAVLLDWPSNNTVMLGALSSTHVTTVEMLGLKGQATIFLYTK